MFSRIFPSDVSIVIEEERENLSPYQEDDLTLLHIFNPKAEGVKAISLRAQTEEQMSRIANSASSLLNLRTGVKKRTGVIGVEGAGKSSFLLDMLQSEAGLRERLEGKLIEQEEWERSLALLLDKEIHIESHASDYPVARALSEKFGNVVLVDLCAILPEEFTGVSQGWAYGEIQRSPEEIDAMAEADLALIEHPSANAEGFSSDVLDRMRDEKGYDVLIFINKFEDSEERHITFVVPENGVLSERFDLLEDQISQGNQFQVLLPQEFNY